MLIDGCQNCHMMCNTQEHKVIMGFIVAVVVVVVIIFIIIFIIVIVIIIIICRTKAITNV